MDPSVYTGCIEWLVFLRFLARWLRVSGSVGVLPSITSWVSENTSAPEKSLHTHHLARERSTSSTRSTSAISGTIVTSSTRPHCQAQHIPRSPKREVCVRKCWEERELCERSSFATAGTILSSLLHQSHLSDSAPSSIITSFLGVGGWNVQTKMRTFAF